MPTTPVETSLLDDVPPPIDDAMAASLAYLQTAPREILIAEIKRQQQVIDRIAASYKRIESAHLRLRAEYVSLAERCKG